MFIVISPLNPDPMYKQVMDQIKDAIADGTLKPEDRLPSIREMARELKISEITIKRAYADLETEGYILTRSGLGSFIAAIDRAKLRREKLVQARNEIHKILITGKRFGIEPSDLVDIIQKLGDDR